MALRESTTSRRLDTGRDDLFPSDIGGISCFAGRGRRVFANLREMTDSRGKAIADKFDDWKNWGWTSLKSRK
jgi:hypothetical protein